MKTEIDNFQMNDELVKLRQAHLCDPFSVLGYFEQEGSSLARVFMPCASEVYLEDAAQAMTRVQGTDFFEWHGEPNLLSEHFKISWQGQHGSQSVVYPYTFKPQLSDFDLHLFGEGKHWHIYNHLGSHLRDIEGNTGVFFAVWAPNAEGVSVVGDFNQWDGRIYPMRSRGVSGVWELFIPGLTAGCIYKYEIRHHDSGSLQLKSDPYARHFEMRPKTASQVVKPTDYQWQDHEWLAQRANSDWLHAPMSVYEVHLGSWRRNNDDSFMGYRELAHRLVDYVVPLGFTHLELLPVTEYPYDASWGYQAIGYFAPTSRFGSPDDFRYFVDYCHQHGLGLILDWVPAHFPKDAHGLAQFDGSALYEHEDPRRGEHRDWGTLIYNYGRNEVKNFLLASALFWLEEFHLDGLRVDAVASMLYLDYSREDGDWLPNIHGGNENLEAIDFLKELNTVTHAEYPGSLVIAEESTSWPQVTRPTWVGGLGFSMKWNMGWMHDSLQYFEYDPVHRHYHHDQLTFGLLYAFTENFMLPFSHDEMVHGKRSMINKMPGDDWQRFANLRLLYSYMFTYPGKKLLFMGSEFAQSNEWQHDQALDWHDLDNENNKGIYKMIGDLNRLYKSCPALFYYDFDQQGFEWVDCHDAAQSVLSYVRRADNEELVVVLNFTPVPRKNYRIGVSTAGCYQEIFNSDSTYYGGSDVGNDGRLASEPKPWMNHDNSINIVLPPLAVLVFKKE
ncbi:MAG: 1,4-alpha-glucan branching protein GlgB [Gammaproteobacteria bacterium]|nr:1,4-alpha-glucan branching protein GlgB [Gammaproteobacteria bacterium]